MLIEKGRAEKDYIMINVSEAQELVRKNAIDLKTEAVPLGNCAGKVLAEEVWADRDYPPFNRSAMDGYAIRSDNYQQGRFFVVADTLFAGDFREKKYGNGEVVKIMTGAPVPDSFDAVIRIEDAETVNGSVKFGLPSVSPYEHIARQGEDLKEHELALRVGQRISPAEIALLASLGKSSVKVFASPVVSVISTGDEIKAVGEPVLPHQIRNANGPVLSAFFKKFGVYNVLDSLVNDDPEMLRSAIEKALAFSDVVVLSGGVSMGEADFVPETLQGLGVEKIFHKVMLKPGKPVWFGKKTGGPVVFGLPGNPFSGQVTFKLFIEPFLRESYRLNPLRPLYLPAAFDRIKHNEMEEYIPAIITEEDGLSKVRACSFNGSGDVTATAMSEGLVLHPAGHPSIKKGDMVAFYGW